MRIDYEAALTRVLEGKFPPPRMTDAKALLARYAADAPPSEGARVQLAIQRLCGGDLDRLAHFVGRASEDYRDLRCWAEYPHTAAVPGLRQQEPARYQALRQREVSEYQRWIETGAVTD